MLKFAQNRINLYEIKSKEFKHSIPAVIVNPKNISDDSVVFIFNGGIGNSIPSCLYMDNIAYDNHYFVTYEKAGHNENRNKPSQFKKFYLKELDEVVRWTKTQLPNRRIYLLGESWGTAINFVYYKNNKNKVNGTVGWNMPFTIANPDKKSAKELYSIAWRELLTLLFNVECHIPPVQKGQEQFSRDPLFARLLHIVPPSKTNTKINLAVWRYMRPSFKFICKYGRHSLYNFMYVQSGQDVMSNAKKVRKISKKADSKHFTMFPTGYHVLSMEPKESIDLYKLVLKFIEENK
ncbi:MAG: alpha/beta fold hydrolase [Mycoplasmoidaceae bacterium]